MADKTGGVTIKVQIDDKEVAAGFARLTAHMRDTTPVMRSIGVGISGNVQRRIGSGYFEGKWPALNTQYKKGKKNRRMMVESGLLRSSITSAPGNGYVFVGTNRIYAAIQQFGGTITPKKAARLAFRMGGQFFSATSVTIPARPFLTIEQEDRDIISDIVFARLEKARKS